ncbi:INVS [Mytilus edulis]|uniref:INVS n=1 Tax=Mytilus edulis TaxID=6550 RepID=A0A8S3T720_MYTED|nr:INVS [Mytilus edulis]
MKVKQFFICVPRHKSTKCMNLLLRQLSQKKLTIRTRKKRTALHWAASYGNVEHVKLLIKQISGRRFESFMSKQEDSNIGIPDIEAVADGNESIVKVLISVVNSNISALDNMFRTPLHWAAVLGHSGIVSLLIMDTVGVLTYKIAVDEPDVEGRSSVYV